VRLKEAAEKAKEMADNGGSPQKKKKSEDEQAGNEETEDNLITYREFINAIKALKSLYKRILPRTLAFRDVL